MPEPSLRPQSGQLVDTARPEKEDQEETEAQGEEKSGEAEGEAEGEAATQTSNALWSP